MTASTPSSRQARRIRSAISPRFAMRTLRNTSGTGPVRGTGRGRVVLDDQQLLAIFDGLAWLHEARADHAVDGREDLLGNAEHVHGAQPIPALDAGPGGQVRTRLEDADRR